MAGGRVRTALFVPATRLDRIPKALASGADAVIVDLEDAVAPENKGWARAGLRDHLLSQPDAGLCVRINGPESSEHDADVRLCAELPVAAVVVPKAQSGRALEALAQRTGKPLWPIIESARGLLALRELATARGVARLALGALDLMQDLDWMPGHESVERALDRVRCDLAVHARAAGLPAPLDGVYPAFNDDEGLRGAVARARALGFEGMLCIHPRQVPIVNDGFKPSASELEWARRILAAARGGDGIAVDGEMVDAPVVARARRIVADAEAD